MSLAPTAGLPASTFASTSPAGGLPVTSQLREPAAVRNGSSAVKQAYSTAQGFEEMLLQQLSQSLAASSGLGGEGGEGETGAGGGEGEAGLGGGEEGGAAQAGGGMLGSLLPQTLSEGVMRAGGLGLATQLVGALDPAAAKTPGSAGGAGDVVAG
ncbi:MAG TPA: hypothetical protein VMS02_00125, partial [Solirubrobacteraceae bacterium]|nr:hypothetical protein [Solirubrobacteraceae bacterium]